MKSSHPLFFALLALFLVLTPVMIMRDVSPSNELRYLSIVDEALENGNVFTLSFQGEDYADKPPFYFWLMMLSKLIFGEHNLFALCLLSFIPAAVTIGVMDRWMLMASRLSQIRFTSTERFAAAMMLGTSALFLGTSVFLRMDMLMCMFIVLAMYTFYKMYKGVGHHSLNSFLLPFYIFMALFTKGPVGLIMPILSIAVFLLFAGQFRTIGRYLGWRTWLILALFCGGWFLGVWLEGGTEYLNNLLFHQTVDRAVDAFHHKEPIWYYLMVIWYAVAPYSIVMFYGLIASFSRKGFCPDAERFFTTAVVSVFLILSLFSSKLSIYLLPLFPFMAYLFLLTFKRTGWNGWLKTSLLIPSLLYILIGAVIILGLAFRERIPELALLSDYPFIGSPLLYVAGSVFFISGIAAFCLAVFRRSWTGPVISMAFGILLAVVPLCPLLPQVNDYIGYGNLCKTARQIKETESLSGYATLMVSRPESMDAYLGEDVESFGEEIYEFLASDVHDMVLMVPTASISENSPLARRLQGTQRATVGEYSICVL